VELAPRKLDVKLLMRVADKKDIQIAFSETGAMLDMKVKPNP
jgi:hypothetical protein